MIIPDKKKAVSVIIAKMGKPGHQEMAPEHEMDESDGMLKSIAEDLIAGVESKSAHEVAMALKAAFEHLESMPHEEVEHEEEEVE